MKTITLSYVSPELTVLPNSMSSHQMRDASHDNKEVRDSFEELIIVEETSIVHDRPVDETSTFKFRD